MILKATLSVMFAREFAKGPFLVRIGSKPILHFVAKDIQFEYILGSRENVAANLLIFLETDIQGIFVRL